jgi:hypothetical protein
VSDELLDAAALLVDAGYASGAPAMRRALARLLPVSGARAAVARAREPLVHLGLRFRAWDALSAQVLERVREAGVLALLPMADAVRIGWNLFAGDFPAVSAQVVEQDTVQEAIGGERSPGSRVAFAAFRGRAAEVTQLDEATTPAAVSRRDGMGVTMSHWSKAVLCNGLGRYDEALSAAQQAAAYSPDMHVSSWALSEPWRQPGAAASPRRPEKRSRFLRRWRPRAAPTGFWASRHALARWSRTPPGAEELYLQAIVCLGRTRLRTELARMDLLYGE